MQNRIYRSKNDRVISGVCGGIAKYFDVDPTIIRILWVIITITFGVGILAYIICALVIPERSTLERSNPREEYVVEPKKSTGSSSNYSSAELYYENEDGDDNSRNRILIGILLICIGVIVFIKRYIPRLDFDNLWPLLLIIGGVYIIYSQRRQ